MIDHSVPVANDNAISAEERPVVVATLEERRAHAYVRLGNLIFPLSFAIRTPVSEGERIELTGGSKRG